MALGSPSPGMRRDMCHGYAIRGNPSLKISLPILQSDKILKVPARRQAMKWIVVAGEGATLLVANGIVPYRFSI